MMKHFDILLLQCLQDAFAVLILPKLTGVRRRAGRELGEKQLPNEIYY